MSFLLYHLWLSFTGDGLKYTALHTSDYYYDLVKFTMIGKSYHLLAKVTSIYMHYICQNLGERYKDIITKIFLINIPF